MIFRLRPFLPDDAPVVGVTDIAAIANPIGLAVDQGADFFQIVWPRRVLFAAWKRHDEDEALTVFLDALD